ncbi:hypothetical protein CROQUDRAFT_135268 [Cronartium quercuum f. sp. fusiforme G11]|uniref:Uncharacterized protein n=1 Tax=Cronartium quercuum f. sp. fusiforme G11 TaxID=708437 RepID=A0A9P6NFZ5_9BASI|nr:hypothetical protein CROQUDRAFT_135268 [Cronartium quercuum f. sp. fusiforme G11]
MTSGEEPEGENILVQSEPSLIESEIERDVSKRSSLPKVCPSINANLDESRSEMIGDSSSLGTVPSAPMKVTKLEVLVRSSDQVQPTNTAPSASSPASEPGLLSLGGTEPDSLDSLAALDNHSSGKRVDFVLNCYGVLIKILIDTGAKASYMAKKLALRLKIRQYDNPKAPIVQGVWGEPQKCDKLSKFDFKLSGLNFSAKCRIAPLIWGLGPQEHNGQASEV